MKDGIVWIADQIFETLIAQTVHEHSKGLMYIDPPHPVMSFAYNYPQVNKFWMCNVKMPLDIVFCKSGKVSQIHHGEAHSTRIIGSDDFSDLVVELPFGTVKKTGIKIGDPVELIKK
jgi:uncharacterized membrane protein (UPF0127 family)